MGMQLAQAANVASRRYHTAVTQLHSVSEKLATGQRINRGSDDPAGLVSSQHLRAMLATLEAQTYSNQRSQHVIATADGALAGMSDLLADTKALNVQLANSAAMGDSQVDAIRTQINANLAAIDRIAGSSQFSGNKLFDGSVTLESGADRVTIDAVGAGRLGETEIDGQTYRLADVAMGGSLDGNVNASGQVIERALDDLTTLRGKLGGFQRSTLESQARATLVQIEQTASAGSRITDTDYAEATAQLARSDVLAASTQAALIVAGQSQGRVLELVSG